MNDQEKVEFLRKLQGNFHAFRKFLKVIDRSSKKIVPFRLNAMQWRLDTACNENRRVYELKSRQLGSTTYCLARGFWKAHMNPNCMVLVVAHTDEAVATIFRMVRRYYDNLPKELQFPLATSSTHELLYKHGGGIRVSTANSESPRGQTNSMVICSEFAFWKDPETTIAAILQTLTPDSQVILETTAKGFNFAQELWSKTNCGYHRTFDSWKDDPLCRSKEVYPDVPAQLEDLADRFELDAEQVNWAARKLAEDCLGNWRTFCQELALTPEIAFVSTGDRVFPKLNYPPIPANHGYIQYEAPSKYSVYSMGVDVATGASDGDLSAWVVLDCTNRKAPRIVSTFYERIDTWEFAKKVLEEAKKYKALLAIEHNHAGASIIDHCTHGGYSRQYCRQVIDRLTNQMTQRLGFSTNAETRPVLINLLHEYLNNQHFCVVDTRLQGEIMGLVYGPTGKPEADKGKHDDIIISLAIALAGMSQTHGLQQSRTLMERPKTFQEVLAWEKATGRAYEEGMDDFAGERETEDTSMGDLLWRA